MLFRSPSRTRCRLITACCSQVLIGTKRIVGRDAAAQIAAKLNLALPMLAPAIRPQTGPADFQPVATPGR